MSVKGILYEGLVSSTSGLQPVDPSDNFLALIFQSTIWRKSNKCLKRTIFASTNVVVVCSVMSYKSPCPGIYSIAKYFEEIIFGVLTLIIIYMYNDHIKVEGSMVHISEPFFIVLRLFILMDFFVIVVGLTYLSIEWLFLKMRKFLKKIKTQHTDVFEGANESNNGDTED